LERLKLANGLALKISVRLPSTKRPQPSKISSQIQGLVSRQPWFRGYPHLALREIFTTKPLRAGPIAERTLSRPVPQELMPRSLFSHQMLKLPRVTRILIRIFLLLRRLA
jgi:hypothetical protein